MPMSRETVSRILKRIMPHVEPHDPFTFLVRSQEQRKSDISGVDSSELGTRNVRVHGLGDAETAGVEEEPKTLREQ